MSALPRPMEEEHQRSLDFLRRITRDIRQMDEDRRRRWTELEERLKAYVTESAA